MRQGFSFPCCYLHSQTKYGHLCHRTHDYIYLLFKPQKEDGSSVIRDVIYNMKFIFMVNAKTQKGQELWEKKDLVM